MFTNLKCLQISIERTEKCGQYLSNNEFMKKNNCPCNEKIIKDELLANELLKRKDIIYQF